MSSNEGSGLNNSSRESYRQRVRKQVPKRPGLAILSRFMDESQPEKVSQNFDIDVIHILESKNEKKKCGDKSQLELAVGLEAPKNRISSFILVEDLSCDVIEALGSIFNLNPEFFALHLQGSQYFRDGKWNPPEVSELIALQSYYQKAPFYSLQ